jgi:hypothetical protein
LARPKIEQFYAAVLGDNHVGRLEITMHDSGRVGEGGGDLNRIFQSVSQGQSTLADQLVERLAGDELHGNEIRAFGRADVVNVDDIGVIRAEAALASCTKRCLRSGLVASAQDLDGDEPVKMGIEGPVHNAHAALTELCFNPVMAKSLADHRVHLRTSLIFLGADRTLRLRLRPEPPGDPA